MITTMVERGEPVSISFHYPSGTTLKFLNSIIIKLLERDNKVFLQNTLMTVLREMIVNAVKANSKRVLFEKMKLNINDRRDYNRGMEAFKSYIVECENSEKELKNANRRVIFGLKKIDQGIKVIIQNTSRIHPEELERIRQRIERAKKYQEFMEIYEDISDDTEGEGLGILLTMLFLRNSGIGEESFRVVSDGELTQSSFVIPRVLKPVEITNEIKDRILREVDELPTFPENIHLLMNLCKDPDASIKEIADRIILDPSLSASVLRLSNSAGFITGKRIEFIDEAIMVIGLKNLYGLLIASSAKKILEERYSSFKSIWDHCNKTAVYARVIAARLGRRETMEQSAIAGLLHDLGKIVLLSINASLSEWIAEMTINRKIRTSTVLEETAIGMCHSTIGELIARKWNLPGYLVDTIRWHHAPLSAGDEFKDIVFSIYLANKLCGIEDKRYDFFSIEDRVLDHFKIEGEIEFARIHDECKERFAITSADY
ncbi:MAG: HDOD domain-containing protein [Spirochaetes bacterium]|nr:HDOD domain-containing protein [Spirochaetota bacterium]